MSLKDVSFDFKAFLCRFSKVQHNFILKFDFTICLCTMTLKSLLSKEVLDIGMSKQLSDSIPKTYFCLFLVEGVIITDMG